MSSWSNVKPATLAENSRGFRRSRGTARRSKVLRPWHDGFGLFLLKTAPIR
jgi:hypothetical protein